MLQLQLLPACQLPVRGSRLLGRPIIYGVAANAQGRAASRDGQVQTGAISSLTTFDRPLDDS
eukprot:COSAG04_NODE_13914_length_587_cov_1.000000_2_plen_61_part_01